MKTPIVIGLLAFTVTGNAMANGVPSYKLMIERLLDNRKLDNYWHAKAYPERVPLIVSLPCEVDANALHIEKFGEPVVFVHDKKRRRNVFEILYVDRGWPQFSVGFAYPAEHITGTADFTKSKNGYRLSEIHIREHDGQQTTRPEEWHITPNGIGPVTLGMTGKGIAAELGPEFTVKGPGRIRVSLYGYTIFRNGEPQFYAGWWGKGEKAVSLILVSNPAYQTKAGIGPGSTLAEAAAAYGKAELTYSTEAESREWIHFSAGPGDGIAFEVTGPDGARFAGIYPPSEGSGSHSTDKWRKGSKIDMIWIGG